jgi:hypothetical protein
MAVTDQTIQFPANVDILGNVLMRGTKPAYARNELTQDNNLSFGIPLQSFRIWDEFDRHLPDLAIKSAIVASFAWDPTTADSSFFVAGRDYRVLGITARVEVAGTGGACTAIIKKAPSATDIAAGTALHSSSINLVGTVDTNQTLTLSTTYTDLAIVAGNAIGFDITGTPTSARGVVSVYLVPISPDDLAITSGAFGTGSPYISTGDVKNISATRYARVMAQLPENYVAGETVTVRLSGGMLTTAASASASVDVECYKINKDTLVTGADMCSTALQSLNSLVFATLDFNITPTTLSPGDWLDIRITLATVDSATVTAVIAALAAAELLCDVKG